MTITGRQLYLQLANSRQSEKVQQFLVLLSDMFNVYWFRNGVIFPWNVSIDLIKQHYNNWYFIKLCHLMTLSVCEIILCWWQISKWLRCIGRLILATDSWSTETDLSHCHWSTLNKRQTDQEMNPGLWDGRLLTNYLSFFIILYFN
jgi:hypothetical protein